MAYMLSSSNGKIYNLDTGQLVRDQTTISFVKKRITHLRVPPAYKDVCIYTSPDSKLLASAKDSKNRTQCIYNPAFIEQQKQQRFHNIRKYDGLIRKIVRKVRSVVRAGNNTSGGASAAVDIKELQICIVLHIMMRCNFRIGNEKYAKDNQSYGLTTLECRHASTHKNGKTVSFNFVGKKGVLNVSKCSDPDVFAYIKASKDRCSDNPSEKLFPAISSNKVNAWLRKFDRSADITSKDLRTWQANQLYKKYVKNNGSHKGALKFVADKLHNTPTVCRKNYIDPEILTNRPSSNKHIPTAQ